MKQTLLLCSLLAIVPFQSALAAPAPTEWCCTCKCIGSGGTSLRSSLVPIDHKFQSVTDSEAACKKLTGQCAGYNDAGKLETGKLSCGSAVLVPKGACGQNSTTPFRP
jgi:hypothetical protein